MDGRDLLEAIRDDHETPLSRLGSSKWVYALTGGEMDAEHVRRAAADEASVAATTFDAWAADEGDETAAETFAAVADTARDHLDTVCPEEYRPDDSLPTYDTLAGVEGTAARAGALLARTVVTGRTLGQMVGFFVGDADPSTASTFRDLKADVENGREDAIDLLDSVCADDDDWVAARRAADEVIEAAYDDYVETLESMGVKPKNVC